MPVKIKKTSNADVAVTDSSVQIYRFGKINDVPLSQCSKERFGGKGANLMAMVHHDLPVPSGFTIPCRSSVKYLSCITNASKIALGMQVKAALKQGVAYLTDVFGYTPLMSVRSGARVSMPGMMDTILNIGLTTATLPFWVERLGERAALDTHRRFIQMFASVALDVPLPLFEAALTKVRKTEGVESDSEISVPGLKAVIHLYNAILFDKGLTIPDNVEEQLAVATMAVFRSWNNERAKEYRKIHGYPSDWGTAVNVQAMVFGNLNDNSATGVLFTRDPSTGAPGVVGEYLVNAQGEDVVAGIRTPEPFHTMSGWNNACRQQLLSMCSKLEDMNKDMQDIEFTIQDGEVFLLQTRNGKRSPKAAFAIAHDLANANVITREEAVGRVTSAQLMSLMTARIDPGFTTPPSLTGIAAGGGLVKGVAMFSAASAVNCTQPCILVRKETDPDDLAGMNAALGILTATGGLTSHAAVVARGLNKTCVVGATDLVIAPSEDSAEVKDSLLEFGEGVLLTLDGATGRVWVGLDVPVIPGTLTKEAAEILEWALAGRPTRLTLGSGSTIEDIEQAYEAGTAPMYLDAVSVPAKRFDNPESEEGGKTLDFFCKLLTVHRKYERSLVIRLCPSADHLEESDTVFDTMFGDTHAHCDVALMSCLYKALSLNSMKGKPWSNLRVEVSKPVKNPHAVWDMMINLVTGLGLTSGSGSKVTSIKDLLQATTPVVFDHKYIPQVFGDENTMMEVVKIIEAHKGIQILGNTPEPVYWFNALAGG